jgi:hypothetical protein
MVSPMVRVDPHGVQTHDPVVGAYLMVGQETRAEQDFIEAGEGTRTPDLPLTRRLLYQLSYSGTVLIGYVVLTLRHASCSSQAQDR